HVIRNSPMGLIAFVSRLCQPRFCGACETGARWPSADTMRIALHQPEIAGNVGTILRLAACLSLPVDVIEPCGFAFSDRALARAGMDYAERAAVTRHADWAAFAAT